MSQWRRPARLLTALLLFAGALETGTIAQSAVNKGVVARSAGRTAAADDPDFARAVREWTTKPEFSSPLVDLLP